MFPNVQAHDWETGSARDSFTHQRGILVGGGNNSQFVTFQNQPRPAGTETSGCCFFKFSFEVVNRTEVTFDSRFQVALQRGTCFQAFPEQAVVSVTASVVTQNGFLIRRQLIQFGDQLFSRQAREFRQAFQRSISVVYVSLVVFGMVDFHRLLIEVRFKGIISVRQGWQCITHNHLQYCRAASVNAA